MSRAITGAVEIAAGIALLASPATGWLGAMWLPLVFAGASAELSEIAALLQHDPGTLNTVRQAAAPRRIIYGTQRVGGVEVYESTTGSNTDQYNMVIVYAAHEVTSFLALYLDGRQVYWARTAGFNIRGGVGFGGGADGNQHTAPNGSTYTFHNAISGHRGVYAEARYGDQASGDYISGLTTNDGRWGPSSAGVPSLLGHAYIYLKVEYNTDDFPSKPDAKILVAGKPVYDPRTGVTEFSDNWALVVADIIQNSDYGLGETVNLEQLIAAANICDEQVACAAGMENRYTANYTWTLDKSIGDVLNDLMTGAGARITRIEGEWYLFPATYVAPTASFSSDNLISASPWSSQRKFKDKVNLVQGSYIAPQYPYAVAGNYYGVSTNADGTIAVQDNFGLEYQPASYPTWTMDTAHGYPANQYLIEDQNIELPLTLDFASVLSVSQAQRLAKIALMRNRQQGSGTLVFGVEAMILQPNDTFTMTWPQRGWVDKLLEVQKIEFSIQAGANDAPQIQVQVTVNETDSSVYQWNATDELTIEYAPVATVNNSTYATQPPTNVVLTSSAATALVQPDGTLAPRIQVTWDTPAQASVISIQVQYQVSGATAWSDGGSVAVTSNIAFLPAVAGKTYNVRIRSLRNNGGVSEWVEVDDFLAGLVLNTQTQEGYGVGSLIGEAYPDSTAAIYCEPFTAVIGSIFLSMFPSGAFQITTDGTIGGSGASLVQQTLYYVYWMDPTFSGGDVTPFATTNKSDWSGKIGALLIGSIVTPYAGSSSTSTRYMPSSYSDLGTRTTITPACAYDNDLTTCASVSGLTRETYNSETHETTDTATAGECVWNGFPATITTSDVTITVVADSTASTSGTATDPVGGFSAYVGGSYTGFAHFSTTTTKQTYTFDIPAGTDLSTVSVKATAIGGSATAGEEALSISSITLRVYEIYIQ